MRPLRSVPVAALLLLFVLNTAALAKETAKIPTEAELDSVASTYFKSNEPGAAILVLRAGKPLLRKGYGLADIELGVKIEPDHVFRIGSITKQFTSAAILQLIEQGKIGFDDPITKFFPDYPTQGKTITVEHLLTHTSGIQSYTERPTFPTSIRNDLTPLELIDTFKNDPMKFEPGERYAYNNSAYVILGAIIEKVSGQKYADYLAANVFARAGLTNTYYDDPVRIVPKRVEGYDRSGGKIVNARFLSTTLPFSAGSILSTVDDLAKWTDAVAAGKVVSVDLLKRAWTPYKLTNGEPTSYGYGWHLSELLGSRAIGHGGSIMGFKGHSLWLPDERVFVAVLVNTEEPGVSIEYVTRRLASYAIGKPWNPVVASMPIDKLREYEGVYRIDEKAIRTITVDDDGRVYSHRTGGQRLETFPSARDEFFFKDSFTTMVFERGSDGRIAAMVMNQGGKPDRAVRTAERIARRVEVTIAPEKLDRYAGRYQVWPDRVLTVRRSGNELWARIGSGTEFRIFAESDEKWFVKEVDAQLTFALDSSGKAGKLTIDQGGKTATGPRIAE